MEPILVTGGAGALGRVVLRRLSARGHPVRALSRNPERHENLPSAEWVRADLARDDLRAAAGGVQAVIHCATDMRSSVADVEGTRRLCAALAGSRAHLVYVSIVGIDRVPLPYYKRKLQAEAAVRDSGVPWTIQRATQFHDLLRYLCQVTSALPVMPVLSGVSFQPVDIRDVADRLVDLATAPAAGRAPDLAGPQILSSRRIAQDYLRAAGRRRPLLPVRLPGRIMREYRAGAHLGPEHADGTRTFGAYLDEVVSPSARRTPYGAGID